MSVCLCVCKLVEGVCMQAVEGVCVCVNLWKVCVFVCKFVEGVCVCGLRDMVRSTAAWGQDRL